MGVEPFLIANAINIVVAQRLVRTLCPHCKQPADETRVKRQVYLDAGMTNALFDKSTFYQPAGCRRCNGTGFKGRVGIHEVLVFTPEVKRLILDAGQSIDEEAIRDLAITQKMMTLRQSGLLRIAKGDTTLEAVLGTTTD
jgi:type IV pilus assembly protein PilB